MEIQAVTPGSLADEAGVVPGMRVLAVNGRTVRDFLDLHLWLGEEELDLALSRKDGGPLRVRVVRAYGRELGLSFPDPRIRVCGNDCPFCFVDQLPEGLRRNLYVRDDDYRFSYLYGHFVTLTNVRESEFERIVEQQLSPLYVSVHALDPEVRNRIIVSKRAGEIRGRIEQLVTGGIELHTQVVLVPGVNDGEVLRETIFGLAEYYPGVASVGVVPVGLTGHRENLPPVERFDRSAARSVVNTVRRYGRAMQRRLETEFCYVADEFVILAGRPVPPASYYGNFPQRENGVGLVRSALDRLARSRGRGEALRGRGIRRVWLLTGESFGSVLTAELPTLRRALPEIEVEVEIVPNTLFGRSVTVGGLLVGRDLAEAARRRVQPGDMVLVPDEAVNEDGVFLDNRTPSELEHELGVPVRASWDCFFADPLAEGPELSLGLELAAEAP